MIKSIDISQVEKYVRQNMQEEAIEYLLKVIPKNIGSYHDRNSLILISSNINRLTHNYQCGIVNEEKYLLKLRKESLHILEISNRLTRKITPSS